MERFPDDDSAHRASRVAQASSPAGYGSVSLPGKKRGGTPLELAAEDGRATARRRRGGESRYIGIGKFVTEAVVAAVGVVDDCFNDTRTLARQYVQALGRRVLRGGSRRLSRWVKTVKAKMERLFNFSTCFTKIVLDSPLTGGRKPDAK